MHGCSTVQRPLGALASEPEPTITVAAWEVPVTLCCLPTLP